jgi:leucyl-tRNA synthetase
MTSKKKVFKAKISNKYDHKKIESKWQKEWRQSKIYQTKDNSKKDKCYILDMFPYPSGEGLHVGHPKGYIGTDIYSRYKRMSGFNVLHPMGWDAFGLPTENYAIKNKIHPEIATKKNIKHFKEQLKIIGLDYDWSREINTTDPKYYKWTQWIFLQLFQKGLAYQSYEPINWCPSCKTGLANEDLENGKCERCGSEVEKRPMRQWVLKITDYADRLLEDLTDLAWPESIKESQRNWIGRSEGIEINFELKTKKLKFVILHGYKSGPKYCWFPWLKRELEKRGHQVIVPQLPNPFLPNVANQVEFVMKNIIFDENTVLIGHSLGTVVGLRILERLKNPIKKFVLVSGLMEPKFKDKERPEVSILVNWKFNFSKIKKNAGEIVILEDQKDFLIDEQQGEKLQKNLGGNLIKFEAKKTHTCGTVEPTVLENILDTIKIFTTRADTLFGATYLVLSPEHQFVVKNLSIFDNKLNIEKYQKQTRKQSEIERTTEDREKTGVELKGLSAINPSNGREIPVFIADYVLPDYGTGAVMAVPAHDLRDLAFAQKYNLPVIQSIAKKNAPIKSYLTGANQISDSELEEVGAKIFEKKPNGDRLLILSAKKLPVYEKLIRNKLSPGYWNEYVGDSIIFLFKDRKGKMARIVLSPETVTEVNKQIEQFSKEKKQESITPWSLLAKNEWYKDLIIHTDPGILVNAGPKFSGLSSEKAKKAITKFVRGRQVVKYKLRDWVFSRQRYWGEPIPIIHCEKCGVVPVPKEKLPIKLPKVKSYTLTNTGESPLASISRWVNVKCPICGAPARRETNTMPQWAGSSWYYLRFMDPQNEETLVSKDKEKYWREVDMYVGGTEHATRHLIYARFWHKFLFDLGLVSEKEPFAKLKNQGLISGNDGRKMSKRWGNVINPDEMVKLYGADTLRVYEMFMGPFEAGASWQTENMIGARRFLEKVWRLAEKVKVFQEESSLVCQIHQTIKKVSTDISNFAFNTAISSLMILTNEMEKQLAINQADFENMLKLLAPFAPHLTEELWFRFGHKTSIHLSSWPIYDEQKIIKQELKIVVQVNGKVRGTIIVATNASEKEIIETAKENSNIKCWLEDRSIKKTLYVKDRLINFVLAPTNI